MTEKEYYMPSKWHPRSLHEAIGQLLKLPPQIAYRGLFFDLQLTVDSNPYSPENLMTLTYQLNHCDYRSEHFGWYSTFFTWENKILHPDGDVFTDYLFCVDDIENGQQLDFAIHFMTELVNDFLTKTKDEPKWHPNNE